MTVGVRVINPLVKTESTMAFKQTHRPGLIHIETWPMYKKNTGTATHEYERRTERQKN